MKKNLIVFCMSLFFCLRLIGQNDSMTKALVYFKEKGLVLYLDGKKISPYQDLRPISIGPHVIKAWAPTYELYTDTFFAKKGQNEFYSKKLKHTNHYLEYKRDLMHSKITYIVPLGLTGLCAGIYSTIYKGNDNSLTEKRKELSQKEIEYNTSFSPEEFTQNYEEYYQKKDEYDKLVKKQQNLKTQGIIVSSVLAATSLTFFIIHKVKSRLPYTEATLLSKIQTGIDPINKQVCLIIKLH